MFHVIESGKNMPCHRRFTRILEKILLGATGPDCRSVHVLLESVCARVKWAGSFGPAFGVRCCIHRTVLTASTDGGGIAKEQ
jgi:hypothetical protein